MKNRILFITNEFPPDPGGIGTYIYYHAMGLYELGWDVWVLAKQGTLTDTKIVVQFNHNQPFQIITSTKLNLIEVGRVIRQVRPNIILSGDLTSTWLSWLLSTILKIPLIAVAIGSEFRRSSFYKTQIKRLIYNTCFHVISISKFTLNLMNQLGISPHRVSIIYPGGDIQLDSSRISKDVLREKYDLHTKRIFLTMGSISFRKGQDIVIRAMPEILRQHPDAHYVIVGNDRINGEFQRLVTNLQLNDHITFTGIVSEIDKASFYEMAEFCILPSRNLPEEVEGFGIVVIEAALCGKTSIGTLGTGVEETLTHDLTGLLVAQNNSKAIADAAVRLLSDIPFRQQLETNAYLQANQSSTWKIRSKQLNNLLNNLLNN